MITSDPLALPPMTPIRITDSSGMPGYAKTSDPAGTPSRARELLMAAQERADYDNH